MSLKSAALLDRLPVPLQGGIRRFREQADRRGFAWHVGVMLFGAVTGQAVSLLLSPVLTRIFTPTEFGRLSVYGALLMLFGMMASLGLEIAIPICTRDDECANLLALSGMALAATTTVVAALTYVMPANRFAVLWFGPLLSWRFLFPVGFACLGGYFILLALATRASAFQDIARTRIAQGVGGPVSQITLGLLGAGTPGLVIGFVIGQASGTVMLFSRCVLANRAWLQAISRHGMIAAARRYARFPLFTSWSRVLEAAGGGLVLFLIFSACYSSQIAGFMFLSERVIWRPLLLVSSSLLQVFTGEAGRAASQNPEQLRRRFYQVVPRQFLLAAGWVGLMNLVAGWAFPLLFGAQWAAAIPYMRTLSIAYMVQSVLHPLSTTLQMLERQATAALWHIGRLALLLGSVLAAWHFGLSALSALWIAALAQALSCLVLLGLMIGAIEQVVAHRRQSPAIGR